MNERSQKANEQQIEFWNQAAGEKWVRLGGVLDAQLAPFSRAVMDASPFAPGSSVVDIGCGCGTTAIELAGKVGPQGRVLGVDISAPMLEAAKAAASKAKLGNVEFLEADAQTHRFPAGAFAGAFSRFGVMFFDDPVAAFANIAGALAKRGRLAFVCWQVVSRNPWFAIPLMTAMEHITVEIPADPTGPGPFAFADRDRVEGILSKAGFDDIEITAFEPKLVIAGGAPIERAVDFLLELGPIGAAMAKAEPAAAERVRAGVREALAPFATDNRAEMDSAAWIVTARRA